ncbi:MULTISPECIES: KpsF/GutQ family sugar-phosphate isomerase [unclassified Dyella]|uniref:KpsF/GutQ family sugar-phosphate isomerase n=1 Tax=unclassified Dyella TaxID=2634549 RepID=UPI000C8179AE|nr:MULTISPECIES: KpsF/GutQ family sugar-phosphate isomerase [unclassified Dyella]MDR3445244.1 KpsF/GutQ family sugar-phosphate isomerase [Dyella sp.]PMQ07209.1 Arabinose 5-phosphate isomerase KdsD [Dyella sp. AD56]
MNAHVAPAKQHAINADAIVQSARTVIATEAAAIRALEPRVGPEFVEACRLIMGCAGRVVVTGMGKSGHVARKIAATLASTGTPAFFVHPGEASHGDLGMILPQDVVLALSNSGETDEVLFILPVIKRQGIPLIAITGNANSSLADQASVHLDASIAAEACPLGLAPTASTTAALVMGDALAIALLEARGFTSEDFARSHPAGSLGRRLLLHISDVMHTGEGIPAVAPNASLTQALVEMTRKHLGMTAVVDADRHLLGVFTDGDLRRALDDDDLDLRGATVAELMTRGPKTIGADKLAIEAAQLMEKHQIHALLVVNDQQQVVGALNIHDLLRARVV